MAARGAKPIRLELFQKWVARWAEKQDPDRLHDPAEALLSTLVNLQELLVYTEQEILTDPQAYSANASPLIVDTLVCLCDYASRLGLNLEDISRERWKRIKSNGANPYPHDNGGT